MSTETYACDDDTSEASMLPGPRCTGATSWRGSSVRPRTRPCSWSVCPKPPTALSSPASPPPHPVP